tara:strand:+ start:4299 stop:4427 length:129 start_codon:yes stop_codon:yes gene_type:complete
MYCPVKRSCIRRVRHGARGVAEVPRQRHKILKFNDFSRKFDL